MRFDGENILYLIGGSKWEKSKTWEERKKKSIWKLPLLDSCSNGMKGDRFYLYLRWLVWFWIHLLCTQKRSFLFYFLLEKKIGEVNKESGNMLPYAFPEPVLHFMRNIVPGDIKGEIREVWIQIDRLLSGNSIFFFHMQVIYVFWNFLQRNVIEVEKHF